MPSDRVKRAKIGRRHLDALVGEGYLFGIAAIVFAVACLVLFLEGENPYILGGIAGVVFSLLVMLWAIRSAIRKARLEQELREV
jgi:uncharacterized YccA/Bax inhibitor family protein